MTEFMDDDESCDNEKATKMSNLEMFNLLNPNVNGNQVDFEMEFEALSFEDLKPKMHSIYEDNLVSKSELLVAISTDIYNQDEYISHTTL